MSKLLALLLSFIGARAVLLATGVLFDATVTSVMACALYILLYVIFSPKNTERKSLAFGRAFLMLLFFISVSITASALLGLAFESAPVNLSPIGAALSVVAVPIAEELFFRATLFESLNSLIGSGRAILLSSLLFSLSHSSPPAIILSFILGVLLTFAYGRTGSVRLPILCHAVNNLLAALCFAPSTSIAVVSFFVGVGIFVLIRKDFSQNG
ncbi:MAG: CPBP family intramembrane metalloprotease [Clostridia bacterium]|nr:CPBP family intramembrane metalloprotease [Clostridia bacterium]